MKKLILISLIYVCCNLPLFGQTEICGTYQAFKTTLILKENGSVVETFQGGLQRFYYAGKWSINHNILSVTIDSLVYPKPENPIQTKQHIYKVKRNKLRPIIKMPFTKEQYEESMKNENTEKLKIYSYRKFLRLFKGGRKHDLKRVKKSTND